MDLAAIEVLAGGAAALAPSIRLAETALSGLVQRGAGAHLSGTCRGSGSASYAVSADLGEAAPRLRCTCPSRRRPCKHALALLVRHALDPAAFAEAPPAPDEPPPGTPTGAPRSPRAARGGASGATRLRKIGQQQRGLESAQRVLEELAVLGLGNLDAQRCEALRTRARELADLHLPGVALELRRLASLLGETSAPLEQRLPEGAGQLARLAALVSRGSAWAARVLAEGSGATSESQEDAALEAHLGRIWTLAELTARGWTQALSLVELAWLREEDPVREEVVETSACVDLGTGHWFCEIAYVPWRRARLVGPKASYDRPLEVAEAAIHPGAGQPRVRWAAGSARPREAVSADWERLRSLARPWAQVRSELAAQGTQPLAGPERFALLAVAAVRMEAEALVLEDPAGEACKVEGPAEALEVLRVWGWAAEATAAAIRLHASGSGTVRVQLLAVVTSRGPIRLVG